MIAESRQGANTEIVTSRVESSRGSGIGKGVGKREGREEKRKGKGRGGRRLVLNYEKKISGKSHILLQYAC